MAVRYKYFISNQTYFITFTILGWKNIFTNDKYRNLVYKWFDYMRDRYDNKIYGYVIMPNHIHLLVHITDKSPKISVLIQNAKRFLAYQIINFLEEEENLELLNYFKKYARVKDGAKHKVFEDKYDSLLIQGDKIFIEKLNYIHNNPCSKKWMLADNIANYKYSSAANYISGDGIYKIDMPQIVG
ncbi:MAG: transposase [bacterium]